MEDHQSVRACAQGIKPLRPKEFKTVFVRAHGYVYTCTLTRTPLLPEGFLFVDQGADIDARAVINFLSASRSSAMTARSNRPESSRSCALTHSLNASTSPTKSFSTKAMASSVFGPERIVGVASAVVRKSRED